MRKLFNDGWSFLKTPVGTDLSTAMASDGWKRVDIPHDWLIWQVKDLYESSFGWYKKSFTVKNPDSKKLLYFGGVYQDCTVYVNGREAWEWKYGYSSFEVDVTDFVTAGENTVMVLVRHESPNSRWYSGAGIFRSVYFYEHERGRIVTDSVYFSAKKAGGEWNVSITSEAEDCGGCTVLYSVKDDCGGELLQLTAAPGETVTATVSGPEIWDVDNPRLYTLETSLFNEDVLLDTVSCRVGFREAEFRPDEGFFLNGRHLKLHGVCLHHDLGCLGAAVNREATRRQLRIMKEMGANAVRTSHNMPSIELMELADEMGILIVSEAFDMWELKKTDYDYARFFDDWYKKDVASWVRRDRNHPSLIMWSIGNEIYDTHASDRGVEVTRMLRDEVRRHDPLKNGYTTIGSNYIPWEGAQKCAEEVDLSGYNYAEEVYREHHEKYPHWCIYGSETASRVQSRSVYHFPLSAAYITHDDMQCSSLGNCRSGNGDRTAETSIIADRDTEFCAGQFIWTGFDYLGEPSPYSTKNSYYGQADTAGFLKDSYFLYRAAWTDIPTLRLMPLWDYNDGQLIDAVCYTNLPAVELFINGRSLGRKERGSGYSISWQLPYEKGELKAVGYDGDTAVCEDSRRSFGDTAILRILPDKLSIRADGEDLAFIEISAFDKDGEFVENARERVTVTAKGAGRLVGLDSGDSTDYDEYKGSSKKLFGGRLLAVVAGNGRPGDITVTVASKGLPAASAVITAEDCDMPLGMSDAFLSCLPSPENDEIPVRKIALTASATALGGDCDTAAVSAKISPENATYPVKWTAVTASGVKTNIAEVTGDGLSATVRAKGDGEFRLRCYADNGKPYPETLSELEYTVSGLGAVTVNPYSFVKGSLYNASRAPLNNVSEGGVNIERGDLRFVGFRNVAFGEIGANMLAVRLINWHSNDEVKFTLWLGMPWEDGAKKIDDFIYQADFVWQTYIENRYLLSRAIRGTHDICFEFEESSRRISFGGFAFEERSPYDFMPAADYVTIFGAACDIEGRSVMNIGNNVFIEYGEFDLSDGLVGILIRGRTRNQNDTIHIHFKGESGIRREIVELPHSEDFVNKTFRLSDLRGVNEIRFEFLPGCDFDFGGFCLLAKDE